MREVAHELARLDKAVHSMTNEFLLPRIGVIGGSGLKSLASLTDVRDVNIDTPFSERPVHLTLARLGDAELAFLQRHGPGHSVPPTNINVRANIAALKHVGCSQILSMSAVGSLERELRPGMFVLIDQFIDRTHQRERTFFGPGLVGHVPFGDPTCARMRTIVGEAADQQTITMRRTGTYVVMEGPQFSTRAESQLYRQWGGAVIGMTGMPEAKLAREAEICYAMVAMPTDYDCWVDEEPAVTASTVSARVESMRHDINVLLAAAAAALNGSNGSDCAGGCNRSLDTAIMTAPEHRDASMVDKLAFVVPRIRGL